jgi:hypothetical protein
MFQSALINGKRTDQQASKFLNSNCGVLPLVAPSPDLKIDLRHAGFIINGAKVRSSIISLQERWGHSKSMRLCNAVPLPGASTCSLSYNKKTQKSKFSGLMSCGSPNCVHCGGVVRKQQANLASSAALYAKEQNGISLFVTLTCETVETETQFEAINKGIKAVNSVYKRFFEPLGEYGVSTGIDFTVKKNSRLHLHTHQVVTFIPRPGKTLGKMKVWLEKLKNRVFKSWNNNASNFGIHTVDVAQEIKPIKSNLESVSLYTMKAEGLTIGAEVFSVYNKFNSEGMSWRDFVAFVAMNPTPENTRSYRKILEDLSGHKLCRTSANTKQWASLYDLTQPLEGKEKDIVKLSLSVELYRAIQLLNLKGQVLQYCEVFNSPIGYTVKGIWGEIVELFKCSVEHSGFMSTEDWIEQLMSCLYFRASGIGEC